MKRTGVSLCALLAVVTACNQTPTGNRTPPRPVARGADAGTPRAVQAPSTAVADAAPVAEVTEDGGGAGTAAVAPGNATEDGGAAAPAETGTGSTGTARQTVQVEGIRLSVMTNGTVELHGTDQWGGALNVTYQDCRYFHNAIPSLRRTLTAEHAAVLTRVCIGAH